MAKIEPVKIESEAETERHQIINTSGPMVAEFLAEFTMRNLETGHIDFDPNKDPEKPLSPEDAIKYLPHFRALGDIAIDPAVVYYPDDKDKKQPSSVEVDTVTAQLGITRWELIAYTGVLQDMLPPPPNVE